jgi:hypothetical protein
MTSLASGDTLCFESDQFTGCADYTGALSRRVYESDYWGGSRFEGGGMIVRLYPSTKHRVVCGLLDDTYISRTPLCGEESEIGPSLAELLVTAQQKLAAAAAKATATAPAPAVSVLDSTALLKTAREQAGLPVQDLATMFGVKRRQFYNLLKGTDQPTTERQRRIDAVSRAISRLSESEGSDSRSTRTVILAELDGDSVFAAAVTGDPGRLDAAVERALEALQRGTSLRRSTPPSHRADRDTAAAAREELALSRDQMGDTPDEP